MKLGFSVNVTPMRLELNEADIVQSMGEAIETRLVAKLVNGQGATGTLPRPKDGGRPMQRTGTLASSIGVTVSEKRGHSVAIVSARGDRPAHEHVAQKRTAAKRKTKELRAALVVALTLQRVAGGRTADHLLRRGGRSKKGEIFKASHVRVRTADSNAALAAILSQPPKDVRSVNGGRAQYRVFESTPEYQAIALAEARRVMAAKLVSDG